MRMTGALRIASCMAAALAGTILALSAAQAETGYPTHPIRMIVPYAAGGAADVVARVAAHELASVLGQEVFVDNRGGAGGTIGSELGFKAAADGYTLVMHTVSSAVLNSFLYNHLNFDPHGFVPIGEIGIAPTLLIINSKVPAKTLAEFIALEKAAPGKFRYGSSGVGAIMHLSGELFTTMTQSRIVHVPYRGEGPALKDLLAGQTQMEVGIAGAVLPFIRNGELRALCVNAKERLPLLPDVPTSAEAGLPGFESFNWYAVFGPPGTPGDIVQRVSAALVEAVGRPEVRKRLADLGVETVTSTPAELETFWNQQLKFWEPVVKAAGAKLN
jgi:tripartite-type tricarboxylate transporter receptor subunit TctC